MAERHLVATETVVWKSRKNRFAPGLFVCSQLLLSICLSSQKNASIYACLQSGTAGRVEGFGKNVIYYSIQFTSHEYGAITLKV